MNLKNDLHLKSIELEGLKNIYFYSKQKHYFKNINYLI